MKKLLSLLLLAVLCVAAKAADQTIYLYVVVTNQTANGNTLVINGNTRTATNDNSAVLSTHFRATNDTAKAATNLYRHLQNYSFSGVAVTRMTNATTIELKGSLNGALAYSIGGTWARGILATSTPNVRAEAVVVPYTGVDDPTKTNWASALVKLESDYSTNQFNQNSTAMAQMVGTTNAQVISGKAIDNSRTTNTLHGGTIQKLSGGIIEGSKLSNGVAMIGGTLESGVKIRLIALQEGSDAIAIEGSAGTNYIITSETGQPQLVISTSSLFPTTNSASPGEADLLNYVTMKLLFPQRQHGTTNWWGSHQRFTNAWENIRFYFGFLATNASLVRATNISQIIEHGMAFQTTNFTDGAAIGPGAIVFLGDGNKFSGPSGGTIGNMILGRDNLLWLDDFPPGLIVGQGNVLSNDAKVVIGWNLTANKSQSYNLFGTAEEDGEFRIGEAQSFIRFKPKIRNLRTLPDATNEIGGDLSFNVKSITSLANGTNVIASTTNVVLSLDGTITADSWIRGIQGGRAGKWHRLPNTTAYNIALLHESGDAPAPEDRFDGAGDRTFVIPPGGFADVHHNGSRWHVANVFPESGAMTVSVSVTADGQVINTTNVAMVRLTANSGTATDRTIVLTSGTYQGQELMLEAVSTSNAWELVDDSAVTGGGAVRLNGTFSSTQYDLLTLRWSDTNWLEKARSAN